MFCTTCGAENRETAKFCAGCGVSLQRACAVCAHPLARGARFCDECGAAVGEPAADGSPDASATRKTITVLFADLVGSTSFQEGVDAEAVRTEMRERLFDWMSSRRLRTTMADSRIEAVTGKAKDRGYLFGVW